MKLNTSIKSDFSIKIESENGISNNIDISFDEYYDSEKSKSIFSFTLRKDVINLLLENNVHLIQLDFYYDSKNKQIYCGWNENIILLSKVCDFEGEYLVDSLQINDYFLPGKFLMEYDYKKVSFKVNASGYDISKCDIECYSRRKSI